MIDCQNCRGFFVIPGVQLGFSGNYHAFNSIEFIPIFISSLQFLNLLLFDIFPIGSFMSKCWRILQPMSGKTSTSVRPYLICCPTSNTDDTDHKFELDVMFYQVLGYKYTYISNPWICFKWSRTSCKTTSNGTTRSLSEGGTHTHTHILPQII